MVARYAGRVIDGPYEGQARAENWPKFHVTVAPQLSVRAFDYNNYRPEDVVQVYHGTYHWSWSLRAWCWEAPVVKAA